MENGKQHSKRLIFNLFMLAIGFTIVFIMFASWIGIKINSDISCSTTKIYEGDNSGFINSVHVLNDTSTAVLQEFEIDKEFMNYKFCFDVNTSTTNKLSILDVDNTTLATVFVDNSTQHYCAFIDDETIKGISYFGLRCDSCDTNTVTIMKELLGLDVKQITTNFNDVFSVYEDNTLSYVIYGFDDCKTQLKYVTGGYFALLLVIFLCMLIFIGYDKFRSMLLEGW